MTETPTMPTWLTEPSVVATLQPAWLQAYRKQQWDVFSQHGMPTKANERYKYADFSFLSATSYKSSSKLDVEYLRETVDAYRLHHPAIKLIVLVNGYYSEELSDKEWPDKVSVSSLEGAINNEACHKMVCHDIDAAKYPFASINAAQFHDGLFISIPDNCKLDAPVHVLVLGVGCEPFYAHTRNIILLGRHSKLSLFYEYSSDTLVPYVMNDVDIITLGEGANFELNRYQHESVNAKHLSHAFIKQHKQSNLTYSCFAKGGDFYRDDVLVDLLEPGAGCLTGGFYHLQRNDQYISNHVDINHFAAHSNSDMLYKGVLNKKSKAVFNGRLYVEKDAQKIAAHQTNHNILLTDNAEVYSKPELEIYADDVKCKHGATIGQIDQDALFYMQARGINKFDAMNILLEGFAEEVLTRVTNSTIKNRIKEALLSHGT